MQTKYTFTSVDLSMLIPFVLISQLCRFILLGLKASYKAGVQTNTAIHMDTILDYATCMYSGTLESVQLNYLQQDGASYLENFNRKLLSLGPIDGCNELESYPPTSS